MECELFQMACLVASFRRLDPVCHEAAAWREPHSLGVTVYEPKASDERNHSHSGLALAVHEVEEAVHLWTESYEYIHECGEEQSRCHHLLAADAVGDEAVDEPRQTVDDAVQGQEKAEFDLADPQLGLQSRHRDAEVLPDEIEEGVADHQDDEGSPLPIVVLFLDRLIHSFSVLKRGTQRYKKRHS